MNHSLGSISLEDFQSQEIQLTYTVHKYMDSTLLFDIKYLFLWKWKSMNELNQTGFVFLQPFASPNIHLTPFFVLQSEQSFQFAQGLSVLKPGQSSPRQTIYQSDNSILMRPVNYEEYRRKNELDWKSEIVVSSPNSHLISFISLNQAFKFSVLISTFVT